MSTNKPNITDHVDPERRAFLEKLVKSSVFAVPLVLGASTIASRPAFAEEASVSGSESTAGTGSESGTDTGGTGAESGSESGAESGSGSGTDTSSGVWYPPPPTGSSSGAIGIPEPETLGLLGLGLAAAELARRARNSSDTDPSSDDS